VRGTRLGDWIARSNTTDTPPPEKRILAVTGVGFASEMRTLLSIGNLRHKKALCRGSYEVSAS